MKKRWTRFWVLLFALCLPVITLGAAQSPEAKYTIDTSYEYPILPGTQEWIDLEDVITRREACQIPEDILHDMTTDALLKTVLDYPFLSNIYAFNSFEIGYETIKRRFNGLQELEARTDYLDALSRYYLNCYSSNNKSLGDYVAEDLYLSFFPDIDDSIVDMSPHALPCLTTVYTPMQTAIEAA